MKNTPGLPRGVVLADAGFADREAARPLEAAGVEPLVAIASTEWLLVVLACDCRKLHNPQPA
jgi:hypothetical protein